MSTTVSKIVTHYLIQSYLLKRSITLPALIFLGKFMNFSEAATGGVLCKKLFLKISQYSQESYRPATLLKPDSKTRVFF